MGGEKKEGEGEGDAAAAEDPEVRELSSLKRIFNEIMA
jgi:hypothetical protein